MSYLNDQILKSLREARQRKGFSQRELSARSGVPQSHISRIENGDVDLRVSSLVALARVLDLELELVPRKAVPAVKSIVRSSVNTDDSDAQRRIRQQLAVFDKAITQAAQSGGVAAWQKQLESIRRLSSEIERIRPNPGTLEKIVDITRALEKALKHNSGLVEAIKRSEEQLRSIRNIAAHNPAPVVKTRSAYALDEADDE